ncbi:MAG: hypothetical protein VX413_08400 [Verrucomicrobiota bacterium]|nr:hypothetical protein [Verrucomicrobiota bacterium]
MNRCLKLSQVLDLVFILVMALGSVGCSLVPEAKYPIGIYAVDDKRNLQDVAAAGFNLVTGPANRDFLDEAKANDIGVIASPGAQAGKGFDISKVRSTVDKYDRHSALWSWYLIDEPDMLRVSPMKVSEAHRAVKRAGARKPTSLVLYRGDEAQWYGNIADITMVDRYPVPWLPLANFSQHIHKTRLATDKDRPVIAVIQSFDWTAHQKLLPGEENLRPPNEYELRSMTYSALARGADGIFYYSYRDMHLNERKYPELWDALKRVVAEVRSREALFKAEHVWWPKAHHFENQDTRFNAALEASVQSVLLRVNRGNKRIQPGHYILAVNTTSQSHTYRFRLPWKTEGKVPVTFEDRFAITDGSWVVDRFDPFIVHIYGPLSQASSP